MGGERMMTQAIHLEEGEATGYSLSLGNAPLLIIRTDTGYLMCGYLNMTTANSLGDIAGKVTGVRTVEDMLAARITEVSEQANRHGLTTGITGREFLQRLLLRKTR
jgi:uncharacterized protein YunC (DUF1805 family)